MPDNMKESLHQSKGNRRSERLRKLQKSSSQVIIMTLRPRKDLKSLVWQSWNCVWTIAVPECNAALARKSRK
jgi:hypothetical protein